MILQGPKYSPQKSRPLESGHRRHGVCIAIECSYKLDQKNKLKFLCKLCTFSQIRSHILIPYRFQLLSACGYAFLRKEFLKLLCLLRWLRTVHVWLLVRFSVFPLIYSCACNTCGKLVKGCVKLFKGRGRLVKGRADKSLHLGKSF